MENIKKIGSVWRYQTLLELGNDKTALVLFVMFFYIRGYTEQVVEFSRVVDVKIAPYLYPLFMNDWVFPIIVLLGFIVLVCDAPFIRKGYLFLIGRSGKNCWLIGESLFLLGFSFIYTIAICLLTVVNLIPRIEWTSEWGKVIMTLVRTDASQQFRTMNFVPAVVENYTALEAMWKIIVLSTLVFWFIGSVIFVCNYIFKNHIGIIIASVFIFLDLAINNLFSSVLYRYSPVSMMKLSVLADVSKWNPGIEYAISGMCVGSVLLLLVAIVYGKWQKGIGLMSRREG